MAKYGADCLSSLMEYFTILTGNVAQIFLCLFQPGLQLIAKNVAYRITTAAPHHAPQKPSAYSPLIFSVIKQIVAGYAKQRAAQHLEANACELAVI
ncbi:MAG: hypothetical protein PHW13_08640 [Methylococcales bacterium]|nr:hypothetical protein [Methylococcales bacterium]